MERVLERQADFAFALGHRVQIKAVPRSGGMTIKAVEEKYTRTVSDGGMYVLSPDRLCVVAVKSGAQREPMGPHEKGTFVSAHSGHHFKLAV